MNTILRPTTKQGGFTIVELLIVIVVIGVLATIGIVAFNGVQDRAYDAKRTSAIDTYVKALALYKAQHSTYPGEQGTTYCLSATKHYPVLSPLLEGQCRGIIIDETERDTPTIILTSDDLNSSLSSVIDTMPDGSYPLKKIRYGSYELNEVAYYNRGLTYTLDSSDRAKASINYIADSAGNNSCPHGGVYGESVIEGIFACEVKLE